MVAVFPALKGITTNSFKYSTASLKRCSISRFEGNYDRKVSGESSLTVSCSISRFEGNYDRKILISLVVSTYPVAVFPVLKGITTLQDLTVENVVLSLVAVFPALKGITTTPELDPTGT